jgi:hypothetical protein
MSDFFGSNDQTSIILVSPDESLTTDDETFMISIFDTSERMIFDKIFLTDLLLDPI